jgi:hypothetical protein
MLAEKTRLPPQIENTCLSIPHLHPQPFQHNAMDHDSYLRGSFSSVKSAGMDLDPYVQDNFNSQETSTQLAAAEASAASCADAMDASGVSLEAAYRVSTELSAFDRCRDPERTLTSMAPPKKFYRAFWFSMSLRLLQRWTQEAKSCLASYVQMVA